MNSHTNRRFRELLAALPEYVQQQADDAYALFSRIPLTRPALQAGRSGYRRPSTRRGSASATAPWGYSRGDTVVWFWIGSHADYDQLLKQL